jgi:hypothetical protein
MEDKQREETGSSAAHSNGHEFHLKTIEDSSVDKSRIAFLLARSAVPIA